MQEQALGIERWEFCGPASGDCPGCKRLNDNVISAKDAAPTGPHDCKRDACAVAYLPVFNDLKDSAGRSANLREATRPWWKSWR